MKMNQKLTKEEARELLRVLMLKRERQTPHHRSPDWMHQFRRQVLL